MDDDERMFLLRLGRDERKIIYEILETYNMKSRTAVIRACIRAMGARMVSSLTK